MGKYFNPFKPNYPIYEGVFTGRKEEILTIDNALKQLSNRSPENILFTGERGIGKTSLLLLAKHLATGGIKLNAEHKNIVVHININNNTTLVDFILRFKKVLEREIHKLDRTSEVLDKVWDFAKRIEIKGFKLKQEKKDSIEEIADDFTFSLIESIHKIKGNSNLNKDGIVLIIDEADTSDKDLNIGSFLKNLTESLTFEGCHDFMIIMSGLPNTPEILRKSHESSPRVFKEKELGPLKSKEAFFILKSGLEQIEKKEKVKIEVEGGARKLFCGFCEGYPHFIQQLAYSIVDNLENELITEDLVSMSMHSEGGALDLIGKRYYIDLFYEKIKADSYRQILQIIAKKWNSWITKSEIRKEFTGSGSDLTNGIKALRDRNIILTKRGVKGTYRLQWLSFALWIKIHKNYQNN